MKLRQYTDFKLYNTLVDKINEIIRSLNEFREDYKIHLDYILKGRFKGITINADTNPTPVKGSLYFNNSDNTWYKCEDGQNWVVANI